MSFCYCIQSNTLRSGIITAKIEGKTTSAESTTSVGAMSIITSDGIITQNTSKLWTTVALKWKKKTLTSHVFRIETEKKIKERNLKKKYLVVMATTLYLYSLSWRKIIIINVKYNIIHTLQVMHGWKHCLCVQNVQSPSQTYNCLLIYYESRS